MSSAAGKVPVEQMRNETQQVIELRDFLPSAQLIEKTSWDTGLSLVSNDECLGQSVGKGPAEAGVSLVSNDECPRHVGKGPAEAGVSLVFNDECPGQSVGVVIQLNGWEVDLVASQLTLTS